MLRLQTLKPQQNKIKHLVNSIQLYSVHCKTQHEEIKIPVPWGHLAGKWYGSKHKRPILCLHGWQDNAGTFDTLIPYLSKHLSFFALDLPGHGFSSWLPEGIFYHSIDYVALMRLLMQEYKWEKISLLCHSMSSINAFIFAALCPEKVDLLISLDALKPLSRSAAVTVNTIAERLEQSVKIMQRMQSKSEPPVYEWDELVERLHTGSKKSVNREFCKYLLQRSIKPSKLVPNKYYFSRDIRLKSSIFYTFAQEVPMEMAQRITCPHLFIKASQSQYFEEKKYTVDVLDILKRKSNFDYFEVDGTHHVHLNEPEKVAPIINDFLKKWKL